MFKISEIFDHSYNEYCQQFNPSSDQNKAAYAIKNCKTGKLGCSICTCEDCGYVQIHNNSCRNRHCPCCQATARELWIDKRKSEVIDAPYFHVVFTLPAELNSLIYANQKILYSLLHKCVSETLIELSEDSKYLGATPGIIQVLHTWGQELNYHPHMHCIVSGAGLTKAKQLKHSSKDFFIPVKVLSSKFRGKFLASIQRLYESQKLVFNSSCKELKNSYTWNDFRDSLYKKQWVSFVKETFNGFGNALDYLGRYTHRIAISNARIKSVTDTEVTFTAKDYKTNSINEVVITPIEFIRRFLTHILPSGFQKIRYYGFLNNRYKKVNLTLISKLIGKQLFKSIYTDMACDKLLLSLWNINVHTCPNCGGDNMRHCGRTHHNRN